jgi:RNA polymerase sigma factor (sigma-70 family)
MKDLERATAFYEAKKTYIGFLSTILWQLTGERELFAEAMHCALFGMWRYVDKLQGKKTMETLYHIALTANATAWQNRIRGKAKIAAPIVGDPQRRKRYGQLRREFAATVRQAITELPLQQSKAVVMRYVHKKDYRDIARDLGCSWTSAKSYVDKAVATLKQKVTANGFVAA